MAKHRNSRLARRTFADDQLLSEWRSELSRWGWTLTQGGDGYWYACDPFYITKLYDRNPKRAYALAMGFIAQLNNQAEEADRHNAEADMLANSEEEEVN